MTVNNLYLPSLVTAGAFSMPGQNIMVFCARVHNYLVGRVLPTAENKQLDESIF